MSRWWGAARRWLGGPAVILVVYLTLAIAYSLASPLYEPTDELRHFRYVRHITVYHSLPVQQAEGPRAQSHHPPLYYALGALVSGGIPVAEDVYYQPATNPYWGYRAWEVSTDNKAQYVHGADERFPFRGVALAMYAVRWMTVLLGAGAVYLTYRIGREVCPEWPGLAWGGAALVAFNPQFLYLSGAVNNDIPATLASAAILRVCLRLMRRGPHWRTDVTLGLLYGLALLTKFNLAVLLVLIELAYLLAVWRKRDWRALVQGNLIVLALALAIAGWWFWRNQVLYGELTGMGKVSELWAGTEPAESWWTLQQSLPYLWSSLWGRFGYGQVPMPRAVYQGALAFCALALCGYAIPSRRRVSVAALAFLGTTCLAITVVVVYYILIQPAGAMGRFLFPALPAFALLLVVGISRWFPARWNRGVSIAVGAVACGLALYALLGVLQPAFARPRPLSKRELASVEHPAQVDFGGVARLVGFEVTTTTVKPGDVVWVTVYWQPLERTDREYAVFVHLLSDVGTMVAQRDTYPGLGSAPTTAWDPGGVFADRYRVDIPEAAYSPDAGYIQVGMYDPDGPRLTTSDGQDALRLAEVQVQAKPGEVPNALKVIFSGRVILEGYELDRRVVRPGETMHLTLYWRARKEMKKDYRIFAHVLGVDDQVWAQDDGQPKSGNPPTSEWMRGQLITEVRELTVGLTTPPGFYDIEVGVYDAHGKRLVVRGENDQLLDNRTLLSKILVQDEQSE